MKPYKLTATTAATFDSQQQQQTKCHTLQRNDEREREKERKRNKIHTSLVTPLLCSLLILTQRNQSFLK